MRQLVLIRAGSLRDVARGLGDDHHELARVPAAVQAAAETLNGSSPHLGQQAEVLAREVAKLVEELPAPAGWLRRLADRLDADERRRFTGGVQGGISDLVGRLERVRPPTNGSHR